MFDLSAYVDDQTVAFGAGLRHDVARYADEIGAKRVLILTTPQQSSLGLDMASALGERAAGIYSKAAMHTPVEVSEDALCHAQSVETDAVLSVGGGSTVGLGKALSLRAGFPQIVLPTTYAGSECTPILGQTEGGVKTTMRDPALRPGTVLYDPELVATLPVGMTVTSALNAMAHAVEALYADDRTEDSTALAMLGLAAFKDALPQVLTAPSDLTAREVTQQGTWACGTVLGRVGMALHHKLCHTLGGSFDLPHAETHAIILPHAVAYNAAAVPELLAPVAEMFGAANPGQALWDFAKAMQAPTALRDLGLREEDLDRATTLATSKPYPNPRAVTPEAIRALLQRAWSGEAPSA